MTEATAVYRDGSQAGEDITCPACEECGWFTITDDGACPSVCCQNCGNRIGGLILERR